MIEFGHIVASIGIVIAASIVIYERRSFCQTTLMSAWSWSVAAAALWTMAWFIDLCQSDWSPAWADHVWYTCAVLALCPPIAVLGSRRPGIRVWTWFIVSPMLVVLGWPVITLFVQGTELRGLQLETPQLVAYGLVLVMGVGNYFGTRFTLSALLFGIAAFAIVVSLSEISPIWMSHRIRTRFWSGILMAIAIGFARFSTPRPSTSKFDRLWFDFFDTFGIVWGRRIQDRFNFVAEKEDWPSRLDLHGLNEATATKRDSRSSNPEHQQRLSGQGETNSRMEHVFRWLLRRFVDPEWIDQRLGAKTDLNPVEVSVDS